MALLHRHGDQLRRPSQLVDRGGFFCVSFVLYFFIT
jgi:hypothetical protein